MIENYGHRTEVRKSLASNQDWIDQYFGKILPMMSGQTNVGLISMNRPGKPDLIHPEGQGIYVQMVKKCSLCQVGCKNLICGHKIR